MRQSFHRHLALTLLYFSVRQWGSLYFITCYPAWRHYPLRSYLQYAVRMCWRQLMYSKGNPIDSPMVPLLSSHDLSFSAECLSVSVIHCTFPLLNFHAILKHIIAIMTRQKNCPIYLTSCELRGCCHAGKILIDVTLWAQHRKPEVASKVTNSATRVICKVCCEVRHDTFSELQSAAETGRGGWKMSDSVKRPAPLDFACVSGCTAGSECCWLGLCNFSQIANLSHETKKPNKSPEPTETQVHNGQCV